MFSRKSYDFLFAGKALTIMFFCVVFSMSSSNCKAGAYSTQFFSYPPESKPHEENWEYFGEIKMTSSEKGAFSTKSKKTVSIVVADKNKKKYLTDKLIFNCGGIKVKIKWDQFEQIEIILTEEGNKFAGDEYNKQLLEKGPTRLMRLEYKYDPQVGSFTKQN